MALLVAVVGCFGAGLVLRAPLIFWPAGAVLAAGLGLMEFSSHKKTRAAGRQRARREPAGRDGATRVVIPWRSSPFWDEFDRTVKDARPSEWFCFYGHAGDTITITAEAALPGSGVRVSLFDAEEDHPPLSEATSDARGLVALTASTATTGIHNVQVRAVGVTDAAPQRYRLCIAGPRRAREAGPSGGQRDGFADVPLWHPHHDAVQKVAEAGVMTGRRVNGDLRFAPDNPLWEADFIETLGGCLESQGRRPAGMLQPRGGEAVSGGATDPNRDASRGLVLAMIVGALETAFPGLLVAPYANGHEPPALNAGPQEDHRAIADYNGLLAGVEGFTNADDLEKPASRGEAAQVLASLLLLVEAGRARDHTPAVARTATGSVAAPPPDWDSQAGLAEDFIAGANEALDSMIGVHVLDAVPTNGGPHVDVETLRSTIEAMRERHEARVKRNGSAELPATVDVGATRGPKGMDVGRPPSLRRRNGRRASGFKPQS